MSPVDDAEHGADQKINTAEEIDNADGILPDIAAGFCDVEEKMGPVVGENGQQEKSRGNVGKQGLKKVIAHIVGKLVKDMVYNGVGN